MHVRMFVCVHVCMYVCVLSDVCVFVFVCVCMYACTYVCMHVCMLLCIYVCMFVCLYVCICKPRLGESAWIRYDRSRGGSIYVASSTVTPCFFILSFTCTLVTQTMHVALLWMIRLLQDNEGMHVMYFDAACHMTLYAWTPMFVQSNVEYCCQWTWWCCYVDYVVTDPGMSPTVAVIIKPAD